MYSLEYSYEANMNEEELKEREFTSEMQGRCPPQEPFYLQLRVISKTSTKATESFCWAFSHFHKTKFLTVDFTPSARSKYWVSVIKY